MAHTQRAELIKDFVRVHGGSTRRQIACGLKGQACYATVTQHVTLGRIEGIFEEKNGQIWLTPKGHKQLLFESEKINVPREAQTIGTPDPKDSEQRKPGDTWRFLQQFKVVDLRIIVREEDLNVATLLGDVQDFPEVVDVKTLGVSDVPVEDIVLTLKFKK